MKYGTMLTTVKCAAVAITLTLFLVQGFAGGEALKATPDHFDFGTINEGDPAAITVEIENVSDAPVEITNVRTS
jgi:hypothetical protein